MVKSLLIFFVLFISSCASFDRTNILSDQRVPGLGFSFSVPTEKAWSAVEYGTSNKIHLFQLNDLDNYSILVALNRGPRYGMYKNAETHLRALRFSKQVELNKENWLLLNHEEWLEPKYGKLCVGYSYKAEDWHGRNIEGPITIDLIGLACEHQEMPNVLISIEFSRRSELHAEIVDIRGYADQLFSSFEYHSK
tara:strand:+ start:2411 stop:2992 length:582 start_codon:yes stop_codon:yes gene_type:complete